jgi:hypothetical protein
MMETSEYDAFAKRIVRAYGRRVADDDVEYLADLSSLTAEVDKAMRVAIAGLRDGPGHYSWGEIARVLGVSPQAARQRYGPPSMARSA